MNISKIDLDIYSAIQDIKDTINHFNEEATVWFGRTVKAFGEKPRNINPSVVAVAVLVVSVVILGGLVVRFLYTRAQAANSSVKEARLAAHKEARLAAQQLVSKNQQLTELNNELNTKIESLTEKINSFEKQNKMLFVMGALAKVNFDNQNCELKKSKESETVFKNQYESLHKKSLDLTQNNEALNQELNQLKAANNALTNENQILAAQLKTQTESAHPETVSEDSWAESLMLM